MTTSSIAKHNGKTITLVVKRRQGRIVRISIETEDGEPTFEGKPPTKQELSDLIGMVSNFKRELQGYNDIDGIGRADCWFIWFSVKKRPLTKVQLERFMISFPKLIK